MINTPKTSRRQEVDTVIIDGSLTGLIHALMLKSLGHSVVIFEQGHSDRGGHGAGISAGPLVQEFFSKYGLKKGDYAIDAVEIRMLNRDGMGKRRIRKSYTLTSWSVLYHLLRAKFDGFVVPGKFGNDTETEARFEERKKVFDVEDDGKRVRTTYRDLDTLTEHVVSAHLVIAADGPNPFTASAGK
ncbi:hypothetical protein HYALB_00007080 [Hymenoscyphus albidus]|uniref:FAD-binding domain-containing protein n=1 Tax=Hymenoscyphus albidus TaxID=595503 RepID=A0A9N9LIS0_9HELO|nr:hypothetical protein HYALB_00007080 [Hymenoscyphus albidus]